MKTSSGTTVTTATVLLLFVSYIFLSPSFYHGLTRYCMIAGDFRQRQWDRVLDTVGDDPEILFFYGSTAVFFGFYWFLGTVYTLLDVYNKPDALRRYKVQPGTNEPVDTKRLLQWFLGTVYTLLDVYNKPDASRRYKVQPEPVDTKKLLQVIGLVLFNQTAVSIPVIYVASKIAVWYGTPNVRDLPSVPWMILQIVGCVLIEEFAFYYSHRLLHHKSIYRFIHKKHHEWTSPIAIVAIYAHPLEHIISNLLPPFIGVLFLRCHITTALVWFALAIAFTLSEHSGYHLPFFPSPEAHDYHHFKFNNCFGVLGLLDNVHGTNRQFRAAINYQRHRLLTSLKSMHELYPEKD